MKKKDGKTTDEPNEAAARSILQGRHSLEGSWIAAVLRPLPLPLASAPTAEEAEEQRVSSNTSTDRNL